MDETETRAYKLGFKAALDGKQANQNPYKQARSHAIWIEGFDAGCWEKAKREDQSKGLESLPVSESEKHA